MSAIHVRNVPPHVLAALKRRAACNHRSLQKEVEHILAAAARHAPPEGGEGSIVAHLTMAGDVPASDDTWAREEIYGDAEEGR